MYHGPLKRVLTCSGIACIWHREPGNHFTRHPITHLLQHLTVPYFGAGLQDVVLYALVAYSQDEGLIPLDKAEFLQDQPQRKVGSR